MEFLLIDKSYITYPLITDEVSVEYAKVKMTKDRLAPFKETVRPKSESMSLIRKHNLVSVLKNKHGEIWDTSNKDFYKKTRELGCKYRR